MLSAPVRSTSTTAGPGRDRRLPRDSPASSIDLVIALDVFIYVGQIDGIPVRVPTGAWARGIDRILGRAAPDGAGGFRADPHRKVRSQPWTRVSMRPSATACAWSRSGNSRYGTRPDAGSRAPAGPRERGLARQGSQESEGAHHGWGRWRASAAMVWPRLGCVHVSVPSDPSALRLCGPLRPCESPRPCSIGLGFLDARRSGGMWAQPPDGRERGSGEDLKKPGWPGAPRWASFAPGGGWRRKANGKDGVKSHGDLLPWTDPVRTRGCCS
jgi:hypothetical protein